jgi:1,2-dihydroxy-3-keto-5-methylthiopentene dioxygenase
MSSLVIIPVDEPTRRLRASSDPAVIARELAPWGVRFERWSAAAACSDPLLAHAPEIERLRAAGYTSIDVVRVAPDERDPGWPAKARAMREKFRDEHTHAEDEVRFFSEGAGVFYLRLGADIYALRCEAADLLSVPAGTLHWFDMGEVPRFGAVRFFRSPEGWVGSFTGDAIARRFPSFDELASEPVAR